MKINLALPIDLPKMPIDANGSGSVDSLSTTLPEMVIRCAYEQRKDTQQKSTAPHFKLISCTI
jgi:hypothetical protein